MPMIAMTLEQRRQGSRVFILRVIGAIDFMQSKSEKIRQSVICSDQLVTTRT
jgi:hypothetical protein